jgi:hypothetical protein
MKRAAIKQEGFRKHHPIWALSAGDVLVAKHCLYMEESGERVFTEGKRYVVRSMHPLADQPFVRVHDDTGHENSIRADFLQNFTCVFQARSTEHAH